MSRSKSSDQNRDLIDSALGSIEELYYFTKKFYDTQGTLILII